MASLLYEFPIVKHESVQFSVVIDNRRVGPAYWNSLDSVTLWHLAWGARAGLRGFHWDTAQTHRNDSGGCQTSYMIQ